MKYDKYFETMDTFGIPGTRGYKDRQGLAAEDAVKWAESELRKIYEA